MWVIGGRYVLDSGRGTAAGCAVTILGALISSCNNSTRAYGSHFMHRLDSHAPRPHRPAHAHGRSNAQARPSETVNRPCLRHSCRSPPPNNHPTHYQRALPHLSQQPHPPPSTPASAAPPHPPTTAAPTPSTSPPNTRHASYPTFSSSSRLSCPSADPTPSPPPANTRHASTPTFYSSPRLAALPPAIATPTPSPPPPNTRRASNPHLLLQLLPQLLLHICQRLQLPPLCLEPPLGLQLGLLRLTTGLAEGKGGQQGETGAVGSLQRNASTPHIYGAVTAMRLSWPASRPRASPATLLTGNIISSFDFPGPNGKVGPGPPNMHSNLPSLCKTFCHTCAPCALPPNPREAHLQFARRDPSPMSTTSPCLDPPERRKQHGVSNASVAIERALPYNQTSFSPSLQPQPRLALFDPPSPPPMPRTPRPHPFHSPRANSPAHLSRFACDP